MNNKIEDPMEGINAELRAKGIYPKVRRKPFKRNRQLPGRNDPCPCGSGRKFKHCHELQYRIKMQRTVITNNKNKQYGK